MNYQSLTVQSTDILRLVEAGGFSFLSGHSMISMNFYEFIRELLEHIEELKMNLLFLIDKKKELSDTEILYYSRMIDNLLNEYNQLTVSEKQYMANDNG